jgi:hypothetical protein
MYRVIILPDSLFSAERAIAVCVVGLLSDIFEFSTGNLGHIIMQRGETLNPEVN